MLALNAQMWTVQLSILAFASDEQKQELLPKILSGDLFDQDIIAQTKQALSELIEMQEEAK